MGWSIKKRYKNSWRRESVETFFFFLRTARQSFRGKKNRLTNAIEVKRSSHGLWQHSPYHYYICVFQNYIESGFPRRTGAAGHTAIRWGRENGSFTIYFHFFLNRGKIELVMQCSEIQNVLRFFTYYSSSTECLVSPGKWPQLPLRPPQTDAQYIARNLPHHSAHKSSHENEQRVIHQQ